MKTYSGKTALVTGASSGIGKAMAERLAARGANVIVAARSQEALESLASSLRDAHAVHAEAVAIDLAQPGAAAKLAAEIARRGLKVDLLVNNAGFGKWGDFLAVDVATYGEMVDLNIKAVVELCHAFLPGMAARGDCGILNIGSTGAYAPVPWSSVYAATKAFVLSFSEALAYEYREKGVAITALCPGNTETNFAAVAHAGANKGKDAGDAPAMVADVGLDALLEGRISVISGKSNQMMGWMPRLMSRERVVRLMGEGWRARLQARGVAV